MKRNRYKRAPSILTELGEFAVMLIIIAAAIVFFGSIGFIGR